MPERPWRSPQNPRIARLRGNLLNRPIVQNEANRIRNERLDHERRYKESPQGIAAATEARERAKARKQEQILHEQDWVQTHIAELALRVATISGREMSNDIDKEVASALFGATMNAMQEVEYKEMPNVGGSL